MHFPIAGVTVNPLFLAFIGFVIGVLGGFFGVGGGFLAGPLMFLLGVPMNFVVGTDLTHIAGKSVVAARRHWILGHVDLRLGALMILGTVPGVELGAQIIEKLKRAYAVDRVIGSVYVVLLLAIGVFMAWEGWQAVRHASPADDGPVKGGRILQAIRSLRLPPMVRLPVSGIESVSVWIILLIGFVVGLLAGLLGVGGGFLRLPALIYLLGIPTHVAIGTDLFEIIFSAGYGTVTHAVKGNVDIMMALVMHTGAAIGAQFGALSTVYFSGPKIRLGFSLLPFVGALLVLSKLV
jgi:uncharacterized membrane protein YfcA